MIRTLIATLLASCRTRRRYFAADRTAGQAWAQFATPGSGWVSRWDALLAMADCERTMADTAFGFGDAGERDEDGFTLAQSHAAAADLLELVAATEIPIATGPERAWDLRQALTFTATCRAGLDIDPAVAAALTLLASAGDIQTARGDLVAAALYDAVVDHVGGQAAEVLPWLARGYYLASGGLSRAEADTRWHQVRERSDGGDLS